MARGNLTWTLKLTITMIKGGGVGLRTSAFRLVTCMAILPDKASFPIMHFQVFLPLTTMVDIVHVISYSFIDVTSITVQMIV